MCPRRAAAAAADRAAAWSHVPDQDDASVRAREQISPTASEEMTSLGSNEWER